MKCAQLAVLSITCASLLFFSGCDTNRTLGKADASPNPATAEKLAFSTPYQVVFLDNNNAYIGKLQQVGNEYLRLDNVYYIQSQVNQETKQVSNTLTKRGNELHRPNFMYINTRHVMMVEPVTPDSQVARLIAQSEAQPQSGTQQQP